MKIALSIVALLAGFAVAAVLAGSSSWHRATQAAIASLQPLSPVPAVFEDAQAARRRTQRTARILFSVLDHGAEGPS